MIGHGQEAGADGAVTPGWRHPAALLGAALGAMAAAQVGWILLNLRPIEYDSAWYLEVAVLLRRTLLEQGPAAFLAQARAAFGFKAPGVSMAAALAMAVGGEAVGVALGVSLAAWLLAAAYLYLLARRLLTAEAAALAALLASAMPMSFALARSLLVESSLTAAVVAFLFHTAASERLRRPGHVAALVAWGAAGLMAKVTFPAYVVAPALLLTLVPWSEARPRLLRILAGWGLVAGGAVGVAWWLWYGANWRSLLDYTRNAGFGTLSATYAVSIPTFLGSALLHAAAPTLVLALTVLLALAVGRSDARAARRPLLLALCWALPPLLLVLSSSNRYGRYLAAALPALALAVAALADPWLRRGGRATARAVVLLAGPPLLVFLVATLPTPLAGAARAWVEAPWLGSSVNWYEGPPDRRPWPNAAIVATATRAAGPGPVVLRLNVDLPELNHNNLKVEALLQRSELIPAQLDQGSPEGALATAFDGDLLLAQVGGPIATDFLNTQREVVAAEVAAGRQPYRELGRFDLPGARAVALLERRCEVEAQGPTAPPLATLARGLELVSLEVARPAPGLAALRTRYRFRDGSHSRLAVSVELVDAAGRSLGSGEHPLCRRPPGPWSAGTVVEDSFFLPGWVLSPGVRLRFGLRDLLTGAPIQVERAAQGLEVISGRLDAGRLGDRLGTPVGP
jgi:4-amino-4-deoxy-L-arabinose transferase-like glycosyltransferase